MTALRVLTEDERSELMTQFDRTPHPSECSDAGEHNFLIAVLNDLGFHPHSRGEAWAIANKLLFYTEEDANNESKYDELADSVCFM